MRITLHRGGKERGIIDVDMVRSDLLTAQLEDVGEWEAHHGTIEASVSYLSFAAHRLIRVPHFKQSMFARCNRPEEGGHRRANVLTSNRHGSIRESKLRIRSERFHELRGVSRIDRRKEPLPPVTIRNEHISDWSGSQRFFGRAIHCFSIRLQSPAAQLKEDNPWRTRARSLIDPPPRSPAPVTSSRYGAHFLQRAHRS